MDRVRIVFPIDTSGGLLRGKSDAENRDALCCFGLPLFLLADPVRSSDLGKTENGAALIETVVFFQCFDALQAGPDVS